MAIELTRVGQMVQSADSLSVIVLSALITFFVLLLLVLLTIASSVSEIVIFACMSFSLYLSILSHYNCTYNS